MVSAMIKSLAIVAGLCASLGSTVPVRQKRAVVTEVDWVTVEETITIWGPAPTAVPMGPQSAAVSSTTSEALQFAESSVVASVPTSSSSSAAAALVVSSSYVAAPVASSAAAVSPQAAVPTSSSTSAYVAPTTSSAASPAATSAASSGAGSFAATSGSSTADCTSAGSACEGDITFYDTGLGACGTTNNGLVEDVIALPFEFMGTQSNGNPYCGKTVTIHNPATGNTATGTVVDKCMGCTGRSIDLSDHLFDQLADPTLGRVSGVEWYFT